MSNHTAAAILFLGFVFIPRRLQPMKWRRLLIKYRRRSAPWSSAGEKKKVHSFVFRFVPLFVFIAEFSFRFISPVFELSLLISFLVLFTSFFKFNLSGRGDGRLFFLRMFVAERVLLGSNGRDRSRNAVRRRFPRAISRSLLRRYLQRATMDSVMLWCHFPTAGGWPLNTLWTPAVVQKGAHP